MARFSYVLGQGAGKSYIWWTGFILFSSIICYFFGVFVLRIQEFFFFFSFFPEVNYKSQEISFFFGGGGERGGLEDRLLFIRHYSRCVVVSIGLST